MTARWKYRIVRRVWFDEHGIHRPTNASYQVQKYKRTIFGWRWVTETHVVWHDGQRSPTEFRNEQQAIDFIMHLISGGAVQEWVSEVLPGDFG